MISPSKNELLVAAIQMVSSTRLDDNLATAARLVGEAAKSGAKVIALPEYFCLMGAKDTDKVSIRESLGKGPIQEALQEIAQQNQIYLVGGTLPLVSPNPKKVLNTILVFNPSGDVIARYDKIHLFGYHAKNEHFEESETIEPGTQISQFSIEIDGVEWRFGLSICYDARFPELYRQQKAVDCQIIPAAFTHTTGQAHWEILLRARSIENQCYVLASAQGGMHENQRRTWGQTMLIDPWGKITQELSEGSGWISGTLSKEKINKVRSKLPALQHRKL